MKFGCLNEGDIFMFQQDSSLNQSFYNAVYMRVPNAYTADFPEGRPVTAVVVANGSVGSFVYFDNDVFVTQLDRIPTEG